MRPTSPRLRHSTIGVVVVALLACGVTRPAADRLPIEWLRKSARPFATCEPGGTDRDLASLRAIVGDARIVALGEVSSGTHEFFQMKRRIIEYLATHMGFTLFAIEESMPAAHRVNEYILTGRGDPKDVLAGTARHRKTQEFLDFVEWMREFNQSGRGRLQFLGFDMLARTDSAAAVVTRFVARSEPAYLDSVTNAYRLVAGAPRQESRAAGPVVCSPRPWRPATGSASAAGSAPKTYTTVPRDSGCEAMPHARASYPEARRTSAARRRGHSTTSPSIYPTASRTSSSAANWREAARPGSTHWPSRSTENSTPGTRPWT